MSQETHSRVSHIGQNPQSKEGGIERSPSWMLTKKQIGHSTAPLYAAASLNSRSDNFLLLLLLLLAPPLNSFNALATSSLPQLSS